MNGSSSEVGARLKLVEGGWQRGPVPCYASTIRGVYGTEVIGLELLWSTVILCAAMWCLCIQVSGEKRQNTEYIIITIHCHYERIKVDVCNLFVHYPLEMKREGQKAAITE